MPSPSFAVSAMLVVIASYFVVVAMSWKTPQRLAHKHLFDGNSLVLSISSGVGSLFSTSLACTAILSIGHAYGWEVIFSAAPGAMVGAFLLDRLSRTRLGIHLRNRQSSTDGSCGASYVAALAAVRGNQYAIGLGALLLVLYTAILSSELAVARVTLSHLLDVESVEYSVLLLAILAVCFSYVYVGGYRGVLLTDHLQLLVLIGFFGVLCAYADWGSIWSGLPRSFDGHFGPFSTSERLLLHLASFSGSAFLITLSADNWIRTIGTLEKDTTTYAILWAVGIGTATGCFLILVGASFGNQLAIKSTVAGQGSLGLLEPLARSEVGSISIGFYAALTSVVLTTIDTFIILQQQLYFELISRIRSNTGLGYLFEYVFRWKQIRLVGLVLLVVASGISMLIPPEYIYSFGAATMSFLAILTPGLIVELLLRRSRGRREGRRDVFPTVGVSFAVWLLTLLILRHLIGPITTHLYILIFASGTGALSGVVFELSGRRVKGSCDE